MPVALEPIQPDEQQPVWDYEVVLGLATYRLRIEYSERSESWYLTVSDAGGTPLIAGARLSPDYPIGWRHVVGQPDGQLVCVDLGGSGAEPTYDGLGWTHQLTFFESSELLGGPPGDDLVFA